MNKRFGFAIFALSCAAAGHGAARPASQSAAAPAVTWWADVKRLADDSMRGRETGSPELHKAALYIASQFRDAGLAPADSGSFLQTVPLVTRSVDDSRSSLTLVRDSGEEPLILGGDAMLMPRAPLAPAAEGELVFVGYGLDLPEYGHDDLRGLDLRGKVAVYLIGKPKGIPGPVLAHARNQAWAAFRAAGAIGMVTFATARSDAAFRSSARNRAPAMSLADTVFDVQAGNRLSVQLNPWRGEKLFAGAPERYATLAARADNGLPLPHFVLPARIRASVTATESRLSSENVIGILRGTDPVLRNEYVAITAHDDHLGVGAPVNGDSIYNGAMDNAAGVALLMDMARSFARDGTRFRRSVIFAAVTAEEKGRLGSTFLAAHTMVPGPIVADLNTDMFLPIIPFSMAMANGLEESDLAADALRAAAALGTKVVTDPEPEENRFVQSDHYSFVLRGIPALSLKVGFTAGSPEQRAVHVFLDERAHEPSDDTKQPVNFESAARFERLMMALLREVANRDTRPAWYPESYFKRFAIERGRAR